MATSTSDGSGGGPLLLSSRLEHRGASLGADVQGLFSGSQAHGGGWPGLAPSPVALGHCFKRGGFSGFSASGKLSRFWLHLRFAAIHLSFYCIHWKTPAWREILLGMNKPVPCPCPSHLCSSITQSTLSVRCNMAAGVAENATIPRLQNDWDWVQIQALIYSLERCLHFPMLIFVVLFFPLYFLFVIYSEAETFKMGKILLYIL